LRKDDAASPIREASVADDDAAERARLNEAIMRYVQAHPLAGDTAEGILANWVPARGYERAPDHIEAVLAQLVAARRLRATRLPDGKILYVRSADPSEE
jgi:hypothetical protein